MSSGSPSSDRPSVLCWLLLEDRPQAGRDGEGASGCPGRQWRCSRFRTRRSAFGRRCGMVILLSVSRRLGGMRQRLPAGSAPPPAAVSVTTPAMAPSPGSASYRIRGGYRHCTRHHSLPRCTRPSSYDAASFFSRSVRPCPRGAVLSNRRLKEQPRHGCPCWSSFTRKTLCLSFQRCPGGQRLSSLFLYTPESRLPCNHFPFVINV